MPQFTQKYAIIQLFEDMPNGTEFHWKNWPLHTTIADVFAIDWGVPTMVEKLAKLLSNHTQATTITEDDQFFGNDEQTRVALLKKTDDLTKLHNDVIALLEQGGWKPNNPQFAKEGFLPHATVQPQRRLNKGDGVTCNALSIIDFFPGNDPYKRKLIATIKIGNE